MVPIMEGLTVTRGPQMSANDHEELTRETVFDLMNSPRRRYVIQYLHSTGEPIELQALANQVASWEDDVPVDELTDQQKKRVYVSLYQTHVPKLAESGVITFDRDSGDVEITERAGEVARYLADEPDPTPWELYYLLLAIGSAIIFTVILLGGGMFGAVPVALVGVGISLVFLGLAAFHVLNTRRRKRSALATLIDSN